MDLLKNRCCLLGALVVALSALPAAASTSDVMTVYKPGRQVSSNIFERVIVTEEMENLSPGQTWTLNTRCDPTESPTILQDPDGRLSDMFGTVLIGEKFFLAFQSDGDPSLYGPGPVYFPELPIAYDATKYLAQDLRNAGYTATFQSDSVPEPVTMFSTFLAMGGLGAYIRRRLGNAPVEIA